MAEVDLSQLSLTNLEDELTCSICLCPFDCPVTIPCGHNFCQDCLLATWKDSFSCPQCRTHFATKPELKKNTVLSAVVETLKQSSTKSEGGQVSEGGRAEEKKDAILCDTCMEAEASKTCLTCMASFCEEHLRPHRENPVFRPHQLSEPLGDLSERFCPDHHKLMELFCSQHGRPICSLCLQQEHKGCSLLSPEEQRNLKECDLRNKLGLLNEKIEKTQMFIVQMNDTHSKLKDAAAKRKTALAAVYQQIQDLLTQEERNAQQEVDRELEIGQTKLQDFANRLSDNSEKMRKAREDVNSLLSQSQTLTFLQASFALPKAVKFDPHTPRINLDSKNVTAAQAFAVALKEHLTENLKKPAEARLPLLKPEKCADEQAGPERAGAQPKSATPEKKRLSRSYSPGRPPMQPLFQPVPIPGYSYIGPHTGWSPSQYAQGQSLYGVPPFMAGQGAQQDKESPSAAGGNKPSAKRSGLTKTDNPKHQPRPNKKK